MAYVSLSESVSWHSLPRTIKTAMRPLSALYVSCHQSL